MTDKPEAGPVYLKEVVSRPYLSTRTCEQKDTTTNIVADMVLILKRPTLKVCDLIAGGRKTSATEDCCILKRPAAIKTYSLKTIEDRVPTFAGPSRDGRSSGRLKFINN